MKIFAFKWNNGTIEWVYAPSQKEAETFYINHTDCGELKECDVSEVPESEWDELLILNINEPDENSEHGYAIESTFKEYSEGNSTTDIISTTQF